MTLELTPQIWGITGNLGGGKTLTAVYLSVNAMRDGFFVCSNVTFDMDAVCRSYGEHLRGLYQHISLDDPDFDPFALPCGSPRGSHGGKRVLIVFDECAEWFDQYASGKDVRVKQLMSWIRHSSKRSQDVFLIVQRMDYLQKSLRILISKWVIVDDMSFWRMPVLRCRMPFMRGFVMQRHFSRDKKLLARPSFISKTMWGRFYNTAECLNKEGSSSFCEYSIPPYHPPFPVFFFILYLLSLIALYLLV